MAVVELTAEADAQFHALPRGIRPRVLRLFERLESWPDVSGAKPLSASWLAAGECGRVIIAFSFTPSAMKPPRAVGG